MAGQNNQISGAITFPSNRSETRPSTVQPRQPRNLQGLLKFCMEATKAEDAPAQSQFGPMDEERRKFLEEALKSLTVDVAEELREAIKVLTDEDKIRSIKCDSEIPTDVQAAFHNTLEFIFDIDASNDFFKLGGFAIFPVCFSCEKDEIRAFASQILAELCQNNPFCQAKALDYGLLDILIHMVENEQNKIVLAYSMYALSCATREYEPSCKELISQGVCSVLIKVLLNEHSQVRKKAAFLILHLAKHYPQAKEQFIQNDIIRHLTELIGREVDETTEHLLALLLTFLENRDENILHLCRTSELKNALEAHINSERLRNGTEYGEEKEYCEEIMKIVFDNATPCDSIVDR